MRKSYISFWHTHVRWEFNTRNRLGFLVSHQMVEIDFLRPSERAARYVPIPASWHAVEVPRGCLAELTAMLTYLGSYLCSDAQSKVWVTFYTERAAPVAAFLLWKVYDTYRLWFIRPILRQHIRSLDVSCPFALWKTNRNLGVFSMIDGIK